MKFRISINTNRLRVAKVLLMSFLITMTSCDSITNRSVISKPEILTQQAEPIRPEPQEPHIIVSFYGLNNNSIGRIYFRTLSGEMPLTGSHPGNGEMRVVLPERQGVTYFVTAESDGYSSNPVSYTIQLNNETIYMVGKWTENIK